MNFELALARELLADSRLLLAQGRHRSTVSRAYYAAYHACIALLESLRLKPQNYPGKGGRPANRWEHGIVTAEVAADLRLSAILTRPVALQLRWQYMQRIRGDYRAQETISLLTAQTGVSLAEQIVTTVERYLDA
ncbi:MAG: hypothetical protein HYZ50_11830 [Deltaproteobacteria bacterium]|nr:hypothetical protein [Deltaproteobacteria bacterium]